MTRYTLGACALMAALNLGCGSEKTTTYSLDAEHTLVVVGDGAWELRQGDSTLLRAADRGALSGLTYSERVRTTFGFWTFRRSDEARQPIRPSGHSQRDDGTVEIAYGDAGTMMVAASGDQVTFQYQHAAGDSFQSLEAAFTCDEESSYLGFGAQYSRTNQRGHAFPLWVQEQGIGRQGTDEPIIGGEYHSYYPMPYWLDWRGFGVLFDTSARTQVDLCATSTSRASIEVAQGDELTWRVFTGPAPADVIRQLGDHVGRPSGLPDWSYDLWMAVQGGGPALDAAVLEMQEADLPLGAVWVQDWSGRQDFGLGNFGVRYRWVLDEDFYPALGDTIANLRASGIRFLGYANPFIVEALDDHFPAMRDQGLLVQKDDGTPYLTTTPNGPSGLPDLTNPATREYVKGYLREMVQTLGMDGWMVDFGEWLPQDVTLSDGSSGALQHNLYPEQWHRLSREVMDEVRPDGDYALFSRSGWTGDQSAAQVVWIGDQEANFSPEDGLSTVVPALLNMGLSGVPFVTHDVGGFSGGPRNQEVFMRWTELGAFTPIMRTHEGLRREENHMWNTDAETLAHFQRFATVHSKLRPLFEALEQEAVANSMPPIRHLALVYPEDTNTHDISDQYLLGDSILVAPVTTMGTTERELYLPNGTWYHVWSGEVYEGGQTVTISAPLGSPPVFSLDEDRPELRDSP